MIQDRLLWHSEFTFVLISWSHLLCHLSFLMNTERKSDHSYAYPCQATASLHLQLPWQPCLVPLRSCFTDGLYWQKACCIDANKNKYRCLFNWLTARASLVCVDLRLKDLFCSISIFSWTSEAVIIAIHLAHRSQLNYISISGSSLF